MSNTNKQQRDRQRLRKQRYAAAGVITFIIFSLGFSIGLVFENKRVDYISSQYEDNTLGMFSSQVQYDYFQKILSAENCELLFDAYHDSLEELDETTKRLESYSTNERINSNEFDRLKRRHVITQIKYLLLAEDIQSTCNDLDIATIIYFYGPKKDCPECETQAFVLDYIKRTFGQKVLIFSFDAFESQERLVYLLRSSYDIKGYPSVVVNNNVYTGLIDREVIISDLCDYFGEDSSVKRCWQNDASSTT